jgi:hypothetical protein
VDHESGRTFYYNLETYATQWDKPLDLVTGTEYLQMLERERQKKEWFAVMESNIRTSVAQGYVPGTCPISTPAMNLLSNDNNAFYHHQQEGIGSSRGEDDGELTENDSPVFRVSPMNAEVSNVSRNPSESKEAYTLSPLRRLPSMDDNLLRSRDRQCRLLPVNIRFDCMNRLCAKSSSPLIMPYRTGHVYRSKRD